MIVLPIRPFVEQAGAADHHGGDRIEQVGIELILLGAAEICDAKHAGEARTEGGDNHYRGEDGAHVHTGELGCLPIPADHVHVAAEPGVGQDQVGDQQHQQLRR